jgi:hypothetical protein
MDCEREKKGRMKGDELRDWNKPGASCSEQREPERQQANEPCWSSEYAAKQIKARNRDSGGNRRR